MAADQDRAYTRGPNRPVSPSRNRPSPGGPIGAWGFGDRKRGPFPSVRERGLITDLSVVEGGHLILNTLAGRPERHSRRIE